MFTHIPRTGRPVGNSALIRVGASVGVIAVTAGIALVGVPAASAATTTTKSYAEGQFLSGTLAGTNLANVAALEPAWARNNGTQGLQSSKDPLNAEVLRTINVQSPNGVQLNLGDYIDAGVLNQYARADRNGSSLGASGAIGNDGAIGVGKVGSGPAGDLDVDLDALLNPSFASVISDLKLSLNAVSAQAVADLSNASGSYTIADAKLSLTSPAIGDLTGKVTQALSGVDGQLAALGSDDGALGNAVDGVLDPVLGAVGSSANVNVTVDSDVNAAVHDLLNGRYGNGAVSFNLQTGAVEVDLATLLGGDLNQLAPGTEVLSDKVINKVLQGITDTVSTLADQIVDRVTAALHNAKVTVKADLNVLTPQDGGSTQQCHIVNIPAVDNLLDNVLGGGSATNGLGGLLDLPGVNQLSDLKGVLSAAQISELTKALGVSDLSQLDGRGDLSSLLGGLTSGVTSGLGSGGLGGLFGRSVSAPARTGTICELVKNVLPDLQSTVNVNIVGTVDQLIGGTAATADAAVSLLGGTVNANVNAQAIVSALGTPLGTGIFGDGGTVKQLVDSLNTGLVDPAVTGLLGDGSVSTVLTDILSVKANVQELTQADDGGKMFTETALRISVLPGANTPLATLNVASATVGPNATVVVPPTCINGTCTPCTTNCGPGGNPDPCFANCGPGTPGTSGNAATASDRLAYTGVGIATLIAVILALLAAGAYLAREGYRRNHPKSLTSD